MRLWLGLRVAHWSTTGRGSQATVGPCKRRSGCFPWERLCFFQYFFRCSSKLWKSFASGKSSKFKTIASPDSELDHTSLSAREWEWPYHSHGTADLFAKNIYKPCIIHAKMLMGQVSGVGCFIAGASIIWSRCCFNTVHSSDLWPSRCALRGQSGSREDCRWSTVQKTRKTDNKRIGEYIWKKNREIWTVTEAAGKDSEACDVCGSRGSSITPPQTFPTSVWVCSQRLALIPD